MCAGGMARRCLVGLSRGAGQGPPIDGPKGGNWVGGGWGKVWASRENLCRGAGKVPPKREAMKTSSARGACSGTLYNCCCRAIPILIGVVHVLIVVKFDGTQHTAKSPREVTLLLRYEYGNDGKNTSKVV